MINIGDKVIFMENEHWKYSEEVIVQRPRWSLNSPFYSENNHVWFRDVNGDVTQIHMDIFVGCVRCGDIIIRPRPIKPIQYIEKHNFVG